jgi:hypothetical protein
VNESTALVAYCTRLRKRLGSFRVAAREVSRAGFSVSPSSIVEYEQGKHEMPSTYVLGLLVANGIPVLEILTAVLALPDQGPGSGPPRRRTGGGRSERSSGSQSAQTAGFTPSSGAESTQAE